MDLRGVALNSVGWTWRDEPFLFVTCGFTSREGKSRPFTDGLDVGERVGDPESCRESSEESDRAETAGARAHSLVGPGRRLRGPGEGETSYEASLV